MSTNNEYLNHLCNAEHLARMAEQQLREARVVLSRSNGNTVATHDGSLELAAHAASRARARCQAAADLYRHELKRQRRAKS